jgi:hypothetical protein
MSTNRKPLFNFVNYSYSKLNELVLIIINKMTNNTDFPTPPVSMQDLETARQTMMTDLVAASGGDALKMATLQVSSSETISKIKRTGKYVMYVADGDPVKIIGSGFLISKEKVGPNIPGFQVNIGNIPGEAKIRVKAVPGATGYVYMICEKPMQPAVSEYKLAKSASRASITLSGLSSGVKTWFIVRAILRNGEEGNWTDPISRNIP